MFEKIKQIFKTTKTNVKPLRPQPIEQNNIKLNDLTVFKTPEGQGRWTLVLGSEGQGKTFLVREIAKHNGTFAYIEAPEFQPTKNVDLFVIDDLHKANTQKQAEIFEFLCGARHENIKNIICVTQELKGIPSEVIRRFKVIAFFYSAKQHMKLQTVIKGGLKEASAMADKILRLLPRQYFLYDVQSGFFKNPSLPNTNTELIMKAMQDVLPNKYEKSDTNTKITLENGLKLEKGDINLFQAILMDFKGHPEWRYGYIAKRYGVPYNTVNTYVKRARKRGLLN